MNAFDYFIAGNSAAAVAAIEGIRKHDPKGTIALCSDERYRAYSRPLISYLLEGRVNPEGMYIRPEDFYRRNGVKTFLNKPAVALDLKARTAKLKDGSAIRYGKLLLATGGTPFVPPIQGAPRRTQTFTCWADATQLEKAAAKGTRALVLGAGLIGVKVTEALLRRGCEVTVVELAGGVMAQALDATSSEMAGECLRDMGANVICGATVERLETRGKDKVAVLRGGVEILHDLFICAVGVRPNAGLAKEAGLEVKRGVLVDERMRTSDPHVYAAGDVSEGADLLLGEKRPIPIWPSASLQGRAAGANMAGAEVKYAGGFAMNSVQINDVPFISAGVLESKDHRVEVMERLTASKRCYRRILIRDGRIIGFVVVG
ncbi:MAG TPA: FAD-dependent oxidoreductase, partial [Candidatus Brocadiia bacterium]|nr:FAD-dependent oxidoreductase [Candidatus Brocadiia bacterium]